MAPLHPTRPSEDTLGSDSSALPAASSGASAPGPAHAPAAAGIATAPARALGEWQALVRFRAAPSLGQALAQGGRAARWALHVGFQGARQLAQRQGVEALLRGRSFSPGHAVGRAGGEADEAGDGSVDGNGSSKNGADGGSVE